MALLKGKLFAGALFAGAVFGAAQQVQPEPSLLQSSGGGWHPRRSATTVVLDPAKIKRKRRTEEIEFMLM